jgi:hypothetical protein
MADSQWVVELKSDPSAVGEWLKGQRCREICFGIADVAAMLYVAEVAKRTGDLSHTARPYTEIGGKRHDRWIGVMAASSSSVFYEASHEFGYTSRGLGPGVGKEGPREKGHFIPGYHDLNFVLEQLGSA